MSPVSINLPSCTIRGRASVSLGCTDEARSGKQGAMRLLRRQSRTLRVSRRNRTLIVVGFKIIDRLDGVPAIHDSVTYAE